MRLCKLIWQKREKSDTRTNTAWCVDECLLLLRDKIDARKMQIKLRLFNRHNAQNV